MKKLPEMGSNPSDCSKWAKIDKKGLKMSKNTEPTEPDRRRLPAEILETTDELRATMAWLAGCTGDARIIAEQEVALLRDTCLDLLGKIPAWISDTPNGQDQAGERR